jgi:hypothetical protein
MNINRHNYEEYFILYADNELSLAERHMVESFVENHPDLKEELQILLQSRLIPDNNIVFENKDELLKTSGSGVINLANYQEWLLLYVDDELTAEQKSDVEKFTAANQAVQQELVILQKTKLLPEEIAFPFKASLYHQPEKVIVLQLALWRKRVYRIAAAAVVLFAIGLSIFLFFNNRKQVVDEIVSVPEVKDQKINSENTEGVKTETGKSVADPQPDSKKEIQPADVKKPVQKNSPAVSNIANINLPDKNMVVNDQKTIKQEDLVLSNASEKHSNNLPQPVESPDVKNNIVSITNSNTKSPNSINDIAVTNEILKPSLTNDGATVSNAGNPDLVFTGFDDENNNNNRSRGFFRKAVRFFEKTTKINPANDDDRVLIGGLAVKLK